MRILLVVPPGLDGNYITKYHASSFLNFTAPPLGLAYIAAVLENSGYNPQILDCKALGLTFQDYRRFVKRMNPDFVGIQVLTVNIYDALQTAQISKEEGVDVVSFGGYHPTNMPDECLEMSNGNVDVVFRGESEFTVLEFINCLETGKDWRDVPGLSYIEGKKRENGLIIHNPEPPLYKDIDDLPFPARHLLPMDRYRVFGTSFPATTLITSRGCPYKCDFCAVTAFYNARWRPRSPQNIREEMEVIRDDFNLKAVAFVDDLFFLSKKRIRNICEEFQKERLDVYWGATTRPEKSDLYHLSLMRKAGCRLVFVGVESGDQGILDNITKETTVSQIERFFVNIKKSRMDSLASVSFGFPGETRETVINTVNWVTDVLDPSLAVFTVATPYPGTRFYQQALTEGWIKEKDYSKYNLFTPIMDTTGLTREELKELTKWAYKKFYLRVGKAMQNTAREFRYSLESYGLRMFLRNSVFFAKGLVNMRQIAAL
jgi:radical SAM superfamily enzyme YgiQ (UPF0313 family)